MNTEQSTLTKNEAWLGRTDKTSKNFYKSLITFGRQVARRHLRKEIAILCKMIVLHISQYQYARHYIQRVKTPSKIARNDSQDSHSNTGVSKSNVRIKRIQEDVTKRTNAGFLEVTSVLRAFYCQRGNKDLAYRKLKPALNHSELLLSKIASK